MDNLGGLEKVLVRPKYEHLYFNDLLELLARGGDAGERRAYLHQTEMHLHLPQNGRKTEQGQQQTPQSSNRQLMVYCGEGK